MFHVITRKTVLLLLEEKFPGNVKIYKTLTTTNLDTDPVLSRPAVAAAPHVGSRLVEVHISANRTKDVLTILRHLTHTD